MEDQDQNNYANPEELKRKFDQRISKVREVIKGLEGNYSQVKEIKSNLGNLEEDVDKLYETNTEVVEDGIKYLNAIESYVVEEGKELDEVSQYVSDVTSEIERKTEIEENAIQEQKETVVDFFRNESSLPDEAREEVLENYGESPESSQLPSQQGVPDSWIEDEGRAYRLAQNENDLRDQGIEDTPAHSQIKELAEEPGIGDRMAKEILQGIQEEGRDSIGLEELMDEQTLRDLDIDPRHAGSISKQVRSKYLDENDNSN